MAATLKTTVIQEPSSSTVNITLDSSGNVTGGANLVATGMPYGSSSFLRNRIINGNMVIDQRNSGASVSTTATNTVAYTVDRFFYYVSQASKFTVQQNAGSVTPPVGFTNYLGVTSSSAYTVGSTEQFSISQRIEGYNISDFAWGTANAKTVTLSFWVYSSLTGTFGGAINNISYNRTYPFIYSIGLANNWTYITITIPGDTTGTWSTNNGLGLALSFGLGCGSGTSGTAGSWGTSGAVSATGAVSVVGTSGATFYITGVQLEQGSVATPFERPLYSKQLADCQRYYFVPATNSNALYAANFASAAFFLMKYPVTMRVNPTVTYSYIYGSFTANYGTADIAQLYSSVLPSQGVQLSSFTASAEL